MSGHTKGPWVAGWNGGKSGPTCQVGRPVVSTRECLPVGYGDVTVAIIVDQAGERRSGDLEANARLIAAAPDLLAMVEESAKQFRFYQAQHAAKDTPEADAKAIVNADLALRCEQAIARATEAQP